MHVIQLTDDVSPSPHAVARRGSHDAQEVHRRGIARLRHAIDRLCLQIDASCANLARSQRTIREAKGVLARQGWRTYAS